MKVFVCTKYGSPDVLQFKEVEQPTPNDDQVLIKVHAASLNAYDWHLLTADIFLVRLAAGLLKPHNTRPGADIAGRVEAVGNSVKQFRPGDEVFGEIGAGSFAEYACARENRLALKPTRLTFAEAAAAPMAALTALQGLRDMGQVQPGQKVLINGASGGVGTFAVQFAKYLGAQVTAVCSTRNLGTARSLGADRVIDYTQEDFTKDTQRYDLILAANGYHSIFDYRRVLEAGGTYVLAGGSQRQLFEGMFLGSWLSKIGTKKLSFLMANINQKDLSLIGELIEVGKVKPVIDRCYPLQDVPKALRYFGEGHAQGKVVITVGDKS